ncbi:MAG: MFS transporter [Deltaproteobacteria bacterium]|nr:MAG: MFS transporter [Deltaproteobacteria bacterium]
MNSTSPPDSISPLSRKALLFYVCTLFYWSGVYIYMPILSPYVKKISGSLQAVGFVMGAYGLSQLILRVPLGLWSDRLRRRKPFILLGFIFDGVACVGLIFSESTLALFLSVLSAGVASSMWVTFTVLFSSYFPLSQISQSMSLILFSMRLSQVLSNYSGGAIAEAWGWTAPFYAGLGIAAPGFILALRIQERRPERSSGRSLKSLLMVGRNLRLLTISAFAMLMQFTVFAIIYGFTPIYAQQLGASKADLGVLLLCFLSATTLTTLLSGTLTRWIRERYLVSAAFLLVGFSIFATPFVARLEWLYAILAFNGTGVGFIFPLLMGLAIKPMPLDQQGTAMGFFQSIYAVGMFLGPVVSGWVGEQVGLYSVFILNGTLCLLASFLTWIRIDGPARSHHSGENRSPGE